jgi:undecaprenyl pyrophosphate synthase
MDEQMHQRIDNILRQRILMGAGDSDEVMDYVGGLTGPATKKQYFATMRAKGNTKKQIEKKYKTLLAKRRVERKKPSSEVKRLQTLLKQAKLKTKPMKKTMKKTMKKKTVGRKRKLPPLLKKYVQFVKDYQEENNISYKEATEEVKRQNLWHYYKQSVLGKGYDD